MPKSIRHWKPTKEHEFMIPWFHHNLDIVFFVYGLAYVLMGYSILVLPKKESELTLSGILWLLGTFGISHGFFEWSEMWILIKGTSLKIEMIRSLLLMTSYLFLFEFGRKLLLLCLPRSERRMSAFISWPLTLLFTLIVLSLGIGSKNPQILAIGARYFLCLPISLILAFSFPQYYKINQKKLAPLKEKPYFLATGFFFLLYGISGGFIVPRNDFFPADFFNTETFLEFMHIPVQVFRALNAILISWLVYHILSIFDTEFERAHQELQMKYRTVTEGSPDSIKLFTRDRKLLFINESGLKEHRIRNMKEASTWDYLDSIAPEDRRPFKSAFQKAIEGGSNSILIHHTHEGSLREACLDTLVPIKEGTGKVSQIFIVSMDFTKIRQLERSKNFLFHTIVHDLKNPLTVLLLYLSNLERGLDKTLNEHQRKRFMLARLKGEEISNLISNILDMGMNDEGKLRLKFSSVDLNLLIKELIPSFAILSENAEKKIDFTPSPELPSLPGDPDILKRVLSNLIGNAIKFSPKGSPIKLEIFHEPSQNVFLVCVTDHGPGVPHSEKEKIFRKFVRLKTHGKEGHGLGLAFCKMAVEAHGGKIWVEDPPEGGSRFCFSIPARIASAQGI